MRGHKQFFSCRHSKRRALKCGDMPSKTKRPKRPKINCQYLAEQSNPVRSLRLIEGEFTCPGCKSVLRQGKVFYCDLCAAEFGPCCHPDFSGAHNHYPGNGDFCPVNFSDYLEPIVCTREGQVRCMCCDRMLCLTHTRKADVSRLSLQDWRDRTLGAVVLCPNCKKRLDPEPEPDGSEFDEPPDPLRFESERELWSFLRENGFNEFGV
jgi:hypothetical protein